MTIDCRAFLAFAGSGAFWIAGFSLGLGPTPLAIVAAVYVLVGSFVLASVGLRRGSILAVWGAAVLLLTWTANQAQTPLMVSLLVGSLLGTVLFGVWLAFGLIVFHQTRRTSR